MSKPNLFPPYHSITFPTHSNPPTHHSGPVFASSASKTTQNMGNQLSQQFGVECCTQVLTIDPNDLSEDEQVTLLNEKAKSQEMAQSDYNNGIFVNNHDHGHQSNHTKLKIIKPARRSISSSSRSRTKGSFNTPTGEANYSPIINNPDTIPSSDDDEIVEELKNIDEIEGININHTQLTQTDHEMAEFLKQINVKTENQKQKQKHEDEDEDKDKGNEIDRDKNKNKNKNSNPHKLSASMSNSRSRSHPHSTSKPNHGTKDRKKKKSKSRNKMKKRSRKKSNCNKQTMDELQDELNEIEIKLQQQLHEAEILKKENNALRQENYVLKTNFATQGMFILLMYRIYLFPLFYHQTTPNTST